MSSRIEDFTLFQNLDAKRLELIEPLFEVCTCHIGTIFKQGDPAVHLYILTKGAIDIIYKPYDSPEIKITRVKPNGIFGWSAISENTVYSSGASSEEECSALRIQGKALRELCIQHPQTGEILLDRLAESVSTRWSDAHNQVRDILSQGVSTRKLEEETSVMEKAPGHNHLIHSKKEQIKGLLEPLSAYIEQYHGGSVEYVSFKNDILTVRVGGACLGCPLLPSTLQGWVAGTIHQFFPEVQVVSSE